MAATIRTYKGLVTKRTQAISNWLSESSTLLLTPCEESVKKERVHDVSVALKECDENITLLESSMAKLANAYDQYEDHSADDDEQLSKYIEAAQEVIMNLHTHKSKLRRVLHDCTEEKDNQRSLGADRHIDANPTALALSKLPVLPIPIFSGKRWNWDNFWTLFKANVHDQDLTDLQKFNYLLSSLSGEAKESISRFHVTANNYEKAVEYLQKRYGNKDSIIRELNKSLSNSAAKGSSTADQRRLLDKLLAIASQLREHGEHLDNRLTIQTFLQKFHGRIQKATMEMSLQENEESDNNWNLERWLRAVDKVLVQEEKLRDMMFSEMETKVPHTREYEKTIGNCEYCGQKGHKWSTCMKIQSPSAKRNFLTSTKRCLNCGRIGHRAASCTRGNCRNCQQKHHTAICHENSPSPNKQGPQRQTKDMHEQQSTKMPAMKRTIQKSKAKNIKQHVITSEEAEEEDQIEAEQEMDQETNNDAIVLQTNKWQDESSPSYRNKVILLAGSAKVFDSKGKTHEAIVLLDTGSDLSFINDRLADDLGLPTTGSTSLLISTFGSPTPTTKKCDITNLKLCDTEGVEHSIRLHRNDFITGCIEQAHLDDKDLEFIKTQEIPLSLPIEGKPLQPQILLGCDYVWNFILPIGRLVLPSGLLLIPTKFGYIISGRQEHKASESPTVLTIRSTVAEKEMWDRYWTLENTGTEEFTGPLQNEQQMVNNQVLENFRNTIQHREDGYYVRLPWKESHPKLPDNKAIALKRLHKVLEMYSEDTDTLKDYDNVFKEQAAKGIIEEVSEQDVSSTSIVHYLPHQAVFTPGKETTKLRIVFDASAHYRDQPSLNDVLHQGPLLLPDMVGILLRFRVPDIAVISDVEKAFLQVRLQEADRDATRCMWVRDIANPPTPDNIITYRFTRVTFGLNTSPFLLAATIDFHLQHSTNSDQMTEEIRRNLYVDNLFFGASSTDEAIHKYETSKGIFEGLHMNLREFISNDETFNLSIKPEDRTKNRYPRVLGVSWKTHTDDIVLGSRIMPLRSITKRKVTQELASIYDPMGLLVPILLPAKVFLQSLWKDDYPWDSQLPENLRVQWYYLTEEITMFHKEIRRQILPYSKSYRFIVFTDASQFAIATCIYLDNYEATNLLMAKSKLHSLKTSITIPKSEMNAMILGARAARFAYNSLSSIIQLDEIIFLTDSEIVLSWIKSYSGRNTAGVLVKNRLKELNNIVQDIEKRGTKCLFGHISTQANLADCGTRGLTPEALKNHLWWGGTELTNKLKELQRSEWFSLSMINEEEEELTLPVQLNSVMTNDVEEKTLFPLVKYRSFFKAQRVAAYVIRFLKRVTRQFQQLRKEEIYTHIPAIQLAGTTFELTGVELREARLCLIRDHQKQLVTEHQINSQKNLNIHADENGILRCFGRLKHAEIPETAKKPIYIASKTALARLIILEAHSRYHCGVAHTMAMVRQEYWIPKLRQQVRSITQRCLQCQKFNNLPFPYPQMGNLPVSRVRRSRPFEHIGLDYFGPLSITCTTNEETKTYDCILTCCTTRLVHIELVENLSTGAFINALRRFFARRGVPKTVTCDNAPTFLLGEQILHDSVQRAVENTEVERILAQREIEWIHITPYAPWQGGFYERLIRSIKDSLHKVLGRTKVSFDEMRTIMTEIEAMLNTRPLTHQEERWEDQPILRPIDFLQNDVVLNFPTEHIGENKDDTTYHTPEEALQLATQHQAEKALRSSIQLTEKFWKIWRAQYVTSLREQHKLHIDNKRGSSKTPKKGEVVLLWDSMQPRNTWKIGRIVDLDDASKTRELVIELPNKHHIRRPVNKVVPIEIGDDAATNQPNPSEGPSLPSDQASVPRYNLRKRKSIDYTMKDYNKEQDAPPPARHKKITRTVQNLTLTLTLMSCMITSILADSNLTKGHLLKCVDEGVLLTQQVKHQYELCAEDYCLSYPSPEPSELIRLPPHITIHAYKIKWKVFDGNEINVLETTCKAAPFCTQIKCTFCLAALMNPECWPRKAIVIAGVSFYMIIAACYLLSYIPRILATPILFTISLCGSLIWSTIKTTLFFGLQDPESPSTPENQEELPQKKIMVKCRYFPRTRKQHIRMPDRRSPYSSHHYMPASNEGRNLHG